MRWLEVTVKTARPEWFFKRGKNLTEHRMRRIQSPQELWASELNQLLGYCRILLRSMEQTCVVWMHCKKKPKESKTLPNKRTNKSTNWSIVFLSFNLPLFKENGWVRYKIWYYPGTKQDVFQIYEDYLDVVWWKYVWNGWRDRMWSFEKFILTWSSLPVVTKQV